MRETLLSNCEKEFITKAINEKQRLDGRSLEEFRDIKITFGSEYGSVLVKLGQSAVFASCSCEIGTPKATRPTEGLLFINVELGQMAAVHYETGRNSEVTVQIQRILERVFKDSNCVDLESLCISADDKVWILRLDLRVLNDEGNITDCASIAALGALAHFKRPDVTVGDEIKIHTFAEKDPIPTALHHYPVCVSYVTFNNGEVAIADPTVLEERSSESRMVFGLNSYRELCCLNVGGTTFTNSNLLLNCAQKAAKRAKFIVQKVRDELAKDTEIRNEKTVTLTQASNLMNSLSCNEEKLTLKLPRFNLDMEDDGRIKRDQSEEQKPDVVTEKDTGMLQSNQESVRWIPEAETDSDDNEFTDGSGDVMEVDDKV